MKKRIISVVLIAGMILSLAACKKNNEEIPKKNHSLTIESEDLEYGDKDINELSDRIADISKEFVPISGDSSIVEEQKTARVEFIKSNVFPLFKKTQIYPNELYILVEAAERLTVYDDEEQSNAYIAIKMCQRFNAVLGAERLASLIYEMLLLRIDYAVKLAQKDYDNFGGFYIEDVERYTAIYERAKALGNNKFVDAFMAMTFMTSSAVSMNYRAKTPIEVGVADVLVILKKQEKKLAELDLSESDWHTVGEMFGRFNLVNNVTGTFEDEIIISLDNDGFIPDAIAVMPYIIDLYSLLSRNISKEDITMLNDGEEFATERVICSNIIENESKFREILSNLEEKFPTPGEESLSTVNLYEQDGYNEFLAKYDVDADALVAAIKAFIASSTDEEYTYLREALIGYSARLNSVVVYAYIYMEP